MRVISVNTVRRRRDDGCRCGILMFRRRGYAYAHDEQLILDWLEVTTVRLFKRAPTDHGGGGVSTVASSVAIDKRYRVRRRCGSWNASMTVSSIFKCSSHFAADYTAWPCDELRRWWSRAKKSSESKILDLRTSSNAQSYQSLERRQRWTARLVRLRLPRVRLRVRQRLCFQKDSAPLISMGVGVNLWFLPCSAPRCVGKPWAPVSRGRMIQSMSGRLKRSSSKDTSTSAQSRNAWSVLKRRSQISRGDSTNTARRSQRDAFTTHSWPASWEQMPSQTCKPRRKTRRRRPRRRRKRTRTRVRRPRAKRLCSRRSLTTFRYRRHRRQNQPNVHKQGRNGIKLRMINNALTRAHDSSSQRMRRRCHVRRLMRQCWREEHDLYICTWLVCWLKDEGSLLVHRIRYEIPVVADQSVTRHNWLWQYKCCRPRQHCSTDSNVWSTFRLRSTSFLRVSHNVTTPFSGVGSSRTSCVDQLQLEIWDELRVLLPRFCVVSRWIRRNMTQSSSNSAIPTAVSKAPELDAHHGVELGLNGITTKDECAVVPLTVWATMVDRLKAAESQVAAKNARKCGMCRNDDGLTQTDCCGRWICSDHERGCYREHEKYSVCYWHFNEGHAPVFAEDWQDCISCAAEFPSGLSNGGEYRQDKSRVTKEQVAQFMKDMDMWDAKLAQHKRDKEAAHEAAMVELRPKQQTIAANSKSKKQKRSRRW